MTVVFISLGSNLDDPRHHVERGVELLTSLPNTTLIKTSSLYQTKPQGFLDQPDFINAVAKLETELKPKALLERLLSIEQLQGRVRTTERNRPRTLDLDILLYGHEKIQNADLIIPHPRLKERSFVIYPLYEIEPDLILPCGQSLNELWKYDDGIMAIDLLK